LNFEQKDGSEKIEEQTALMWAYEQGMFQFNYAHLENTVLQELLGRTQLLIPIIQIYNNVQMILFNYVMLYNKTKCH
jgi:hypothetical protein